MLFRVLVIIAFGLMLRVSIMVSPLLRVLGVRFLSTVGHIVVPVAFGRSCISYPFILVGNSTRRQYAFISGRLVAKLAHSCFFENRIGFA